MPTRVLEREAAAAAGGGVATTFLTVNPVNKVRRLRKSIEFITIPAN